MQSKENIAPRNLSIAIDDDSVAAAGTLTSNNTNVTNNKVVVIGSRTYTFKTTLTGAANEVLIGANADATLTNLRTLINSGRAAAAATATLTSDNTNPSNNDQVVVGAKTYVFKTNLTGVKAYGTLTSDNTNPSDGDTVTIGSVTYTFRTKLEPRFGWVANEILIGADADTTLGNLKAAINAETGEQTKYSPGTVAHPDVTCGSVAAHAVTITAKVPGTAGDAIASTETSAHLSWGAATLAGGGATTGTQVVGEEGGIVRNIVTKAPQWAGTPTYTVSITDKDGNALYTSGNLNENATTRTALEIAVDPTDIIKVVTSTKVEETLPITVWLR